MIFDATPLVVGNGGGGGGEPGEEMKTKRVLTEYSPRCARNRKRSAYGGRRMLRIVSFIYTVTFNAVNARPLYSIVRFTPLKTDFSKN